MSGENKFYITKSYVSLFQQRHFQLQVLLNNKTKLAESISFYNVALVRG